MEDINATADKKLLDDIVKQRIKKIKSGGMDDVFNPEVTPTQIMLTDYYLTKEYMPGDIRNKITDYIVLNATKDKLHEIIKAEETCHIDIHDPELDFKITEKLEKLKLYLNESK